MRNLVFFGHHKCASTWMAKVFHGIQERTGYRIAYGHKHACEINIHTNATREDVLRYEDFRGVHLVRDPRDVVVSGYWSHKKTHPPHNWAEMLELREKLNAMPMAEGLFLEMDFLGKYFQAMYEWDYGNPAVLELRYEEVTRGENLDHVFRFLGFRGSTAPLDRARHVVWRTLNKLNNRGLVPFRNSTLDLPLDAQRAIAEANTFERLAGQRRKGQEDTGSHYRKGVPGDWRNHFEDRHKAYFRSTYGGLLQRLGYEARDDW